MARIDTLSALRAKKKEVDINGVKLDLQSLTYPELIDFAELADQKRLKEAYDLLLFKALRKAFPTVEQDPQDGSTDEQVRETMENLDGLAAMQIIKEITKLSGIASDEDVKKNILEKPNSK